MASQLTPSHSVHTQGLIKGPSRRTMLPVSTAVVILGILLILMSWLNLVLTLRTVSIGRQVQTTNGEIEKIQRRIAGLRCEVAQASAPGKMLERAILGGYQYQQPLFVPLPRTNAASMNNSSGQVSQLPSAPVNTAPPGSMTPATSASLLDWLGLGTSH